MKYYNLPKNDLKVSEIALGCMRIADKSVEEVEELVKTALDCGINFFDHADIYGGGKSEELFGQVLEKHPEYREKMIIQTKCAIVPGKRYDFSKEYIINAVNGSLERLHTDHIEILLLHRPDALCDPQEVAEAFDELYVSGKVKYFGVLCLLRTIFLETTYASCSGSTPASISNFVFLRIFGAFKASPSLSPTLPMKR